MGRAFRRPGRFEVFILGCILIILAVGYYLLYSAPETFWDYVREDGLVEWMSVAGLLAAAFVSFSRFIRLLGKRSAWFLAVCFTLAVILFFGAGEEISWGQRILGIESSEFFEKNNAQKETNFHNLIVNGVKINKLIFSVMLSVVMGIYLLVIPLLHHRHPASRRLIDKSAIPVPRVYQVISFIILGILTSLMPHEKNAELLECGTGLLFFLIVRYPANEIVFQKESPRP